MNEEDETEEEPETELEDDEDDDDDDYPSQIRHAKPLRVTSGDRVGVMGFTSESDTDGEGLNRLQR